VRSDNFSAGGYFVKYVLPLWNLSRCGNLLVHRHLNVESVNVIPGVMYRCVLAPYRQRAALERMHAAANRRSISPLFSIRLIMLRLYAYDAFATTQTSSLSPCFLKIKSDLVRRIFMSSVLIFLT